MSSNRRNIYFEIQADDPDPRDGILLGSFRMAILRGQRPSDRILANRSEQLGPAPKPAGPCGTNAFVCSFEVESYDATERKILQFGGTVALPKFAVPGRCWQGYYIDTEGNIFGVFEVDENAGN